MVCLWLSCLLLDPEQCVLMNQVRDPSTWTYTVFFVSWAASAPESLGRGSWMGERVHFPACRQKCTHSTPGCVALLLPGKQWEIRDWVTLSCLCYTLSSCLESISHCHPPWMPCPVPGTKQVFHKVCRMDLRRIHWAGECLGRCTDCRLSSLTTRNIWICWQEKTWLEMNGWLRSRVCKDRQTFPGTNSFSVRFAHAFVSERCISRACRVSGHGFLSSVAQESDSRSLICLCHMKVLEHL
jgi:hypothetical protein